jgi:hypothetical protein
VVVVAGHERHAPVGGRLAQALEQRTRQLDQVGHATLAQLEHVAEQHHVVSPGQGLDEALANGREPDHVNPVQHPEVEVRDHDAVHGRDGVSPTSVSDVSRFCRHNRLTVECPICSKGTVLDPAHRAERRPRPSSTGSSRSSSRQAATVSSSRGPYAAAGPYAGGIEVRLERVPGGLRLAEWQAGQIARKAPELEASDLPGLLADAADKGLVEATAASSHGAAAEGGYGASPGRTGEMRDELRVERVGAGRVRIARWIFRPNAGWQLQEAPVMLPADRFREAIESAAEQGLLSPGDTVAAPGPEDR